MRTERTSGFLVAMLALAFASGGALAAEAAPEADTHRAAYEQLKSLAGLWQGRVTGESGSDVQVRYEVKSNGKAVIEHLFPGTPHEMVTVFQKGTTPNGSARMLLGRAAPTAG